MKFDVIDRMKFQFSPKKCDMSKFRTRFEIFTLRGGRQVCWTPLYQSMSNVMCR